SEGMSYVIQVVNGYPVHLYWGKRLRDDIDWSGMLQRAERSSFCPNPVPEDLSVSLDTLPQEYPQYGTGDFREPAYQVQLGDGSRITELKYASHRILAGKPKLTGLPAVYAESDDEAQTLELTLADEYSSLTVTLLYSVFERLNAVTRSARLSLPQEGAS